MIRIALALILSLPLAACGLSMSEQRKYTTYAPSTFWPDGTSARPLPEHVVAQGAVERHDEEKAPPPVSLALLERGQERYNIYCAPCHGLAGDGDGIVVAHGFPAPPSYHIDRLLAAPIAHFFDVMTDGYGIMYSYADRVTPHDRWAVAAYIRALQFSRRAKVAQVPEAKDKLP